MNVGDPRTLDDVLAKFGRGLRIRRENHLRDYFHIIVSLPLIKTYCLSPSNQTETKTKPHSNWFQRPVKLTSQNGSGNTSRATYH